MHVATCYLKIAILLNTFCYNNVICTANLCMCVCVCACIHSYNYMWAKLHITVDQLLHSPTHAPLKILICTVGSDWENRPITGFIVSVQHSYKARLPHMFGYWSN